MSSATTPRLEHLEGRLLLDAAQDFLNRFMEARLPSPSDIVDARAGIRYLPAETSAETSDTASNGVSATPTLTSIDYRAPDPGNRLGRPILAQPDAGNRLGLGSWVPGQPSGGVLGNLSQFASTQSRTVAAAASRPLIYRNYSSPRPAPTPEPTPEPAPEVMIPVDDGPIAIDGVPGGAVPDPTLPTPTDVAGILPGEPTPTDAPDKPDLVEPTTPDETTVVKQDPAPDGTDEKPISTVDATSPAKDDSVPGLVVTDDAILVGAFDDKPLV